MFDNDYETAAEIRANMRADCDPMPRKRSQACQCDGVGYCPGPDVCTGPGGYCHDEPDTDDERLDGIENEPEGD
mgnify:CR=1 FL=1